MTSSTSSIKVLALLPVLPIVSLAANACLEDKTPGTRWSRQLAATCAYQVRCGHIGASAEAACADGSSPGAPSFLDGRALWQETAGYSVSEALAAGRLRLDPLREAACLDALAHSDCSGRVLLLCARLFEPAVTAGGACRDDRECATGICAVATGDFGPMSGDPGCDGRCVAELATGAACVGTGLRCAADDVCDPTSEVCVPRPGAGDACTPGLLGNTCAEGLVCAASGVCEAAYADGEACAPALFPDGGCTPGLVCVAGACRPPGAEGEACEVPGLAGGLGGLGGLIGSQPCRDGLYCDAREGVGACRARLSEGAECDQFAPCRGGLACVGLRLDGQLGGASGAPASGAPASGRCAAWADVGGACVPDATVSGCPSDMRCEGARCVLREVPTVALGHVCQPGLEAAASARCAEGTCDAQTRRCVLVCGPP